MLVSFKLYAKPAADRTNRIHLLWDLWCVKIPFWNPATEGTTQSPCQLNNLSVPLTDVLFYPCLYLNKACRKRLVCSIWVSLALRRLVPSQCTWLVCVTSAPKNPQAGWEANSGNSTKGRGGGQSKNNPCRLLLIRFPRRCTRNRFFSDGWVFSYKG